MFNKSHQQAVIQMRFSPKFFEQLIEMDVELNHVDYETPAGKDVTVNWKMYDGFDPKGKFWTDSNALTMLERNLYDHGGYKVPLPNSNISSNYFPIDSAIAMRDTSGSNIQVTVMNDRAQGGSADLSGKAQIELMQQRRTGFDDDKGVQEFLNETDSSGIGVRITARYFVQIFNFETGHSLQRQQQILVDQPIQYKYAFEFEKTNSSSGVVPSAPELDGSLTYQLFPLGKNKVMVRIINLADRLDNSHPTEYVDLLKFATSLYAEANPSSK